MPSLPPDRVSVDSGAVPGELLQPAGAGAVRREPLVIAILLLGLAALFAASLSLTRAFESRRRQLAEQWFQRGQAELAAGQSEPAISDFHSALLYQRDDPEYRLALAEALFGGKQYSQAEAYFQSLLESHPGDGYVNLELARLAARTNRADDAVRFYQSAIYGVWVSRADEYRRTARLELIQLLLENHRNAEAEAELVSLSAELPNSPALLMEAAAMFERLGDHDRAAALYQRVLRVEPHNTRALVGLATAEFDSGHYAPARQHLTALLAQNASPDGSPGASKDASNQALRKMAETADLVLALDPVARVSGPQRRSRLMRDFQIAAARLQQCRSMGKLEPPAQPAASGKPSSGTTGETASDLASLASRFATMTPHMTERNLRDDPDLAQNALDLIFAIERQAQSICGPLTPEDDALLRIATMHTQ